MSSRILTYPLDTIKSRLQVQGSGANAGKPKLDTTQMIRQVFRSEGVRGFYRGFGGIMLTVIPANMCYFGGYELGKRVTRRELGAASDVLTALIAQSLAGLIYCPIDIVKQRVQTATLLDGTPGSGPGTNQPRRLGVMQAARGIWHTQGAPGFFRGFLTMNALWMPYNLIYIPTYEAAKRRWYYAMLARRRERLHADRLGGAGATGGTTGMFADPPMQQLLPLWAFPLCSSACSAVAAAVTHPIDVVKTRLQVLSTVDPSQRLSALQVAGRLLQREGLRGFTRGLGARVLTMASGSSVSWFAYEVVKRELQHLEY